MIQIVYSGEARTVSALHEYMQTLMPRTPHGTVKFQSKMKENADGVTARLSLEVPPEFFDELFGQGWRSDAGAPTSNVAGHNGDGGQINRYRIDYRSNR
jgi:hypothetical protein